MRRLLYLALLAVPCVMWSLFPAPASAGPERAAARPAKPSAAVERGPAPRPPGQEIVGLRTANSKTFARTDGRRVVRVSSGRVHFRNARGRWQDVDTRLRRAHGRLLNRTNGFSTSLPERLGTDTVRVRRGRWSMAFRLRGAHATAAPSGSRVVYRDAFPGVDLDYRLTGDALKETLTLAGPDARRRFVFDVDPGPGLRPQLLRTKGLLFVDRRGTRRLSMGAPFLIDRNGKTARAGLKLDNVRGAWRLTVVAPSRWLDAPGRAWPVALDPTVYPANDADCILDQDGPQASYCALNQLHVGGQNGKELRTLLRFGDVQAAVPRGADVAGASLNLFQTFTNAPANVGVSGRALAEAWGPGVSWDRRNGEDRWSEAGGEVDRTDAGKVEWGTSFGPGNGLRSLALFGLVRDWVSGKRPNHGLVLQADSLSHYAIFASAEDADLAKRPQLEITYWPRTGDRRGYVQERQRLSDRISMGVNVASGNLNVAQTDFSMPGGLGPDVAVGRSYNSLQPLSGAFESRWQLDGGPDVRIEQASGGRYVSVTYAGGATVPYTRKADGGYQTPPGFDNTLTRDDATGRYTLTENRSQTKSEFAAFAQGGRLEKVTDRNGRALTYVYDGTTGRLARIEGAHTVQGSAGDEPRFTWSGDHIAAMTDPAGRSYGYGYTGELLTSYTDPENGTANKTLYEYAGPDDRLSKITTPGGRITTIEYYPDGHEHAGKVKAFTRVTNSTNLTGARWELDYLIRRDGSGETRVTDPIGVSTPDTSDRVTTYSFDGDGRVTKTKDALGRETQRKITSTSKVESYTAAGNTGTTPNTTFTYEPETDNLASTETPTGEGLQDMKTTSTYGAGDQINAGTDGDEYLPTAHVNEQGNVTRTRYQVGAQTNGNVSSVQSFKQTAGQPDTLVSGVTFEYDSRPAGTAGVVDGKPGQLKTVRDGRNTPTSYTYDGKGNVVVIDAPEPLGDTNIEYHPTLGRIAKVKDGKGNWRLLVYDNLDRLTKIEFTGANQTLDAPEPYVAYTYDRDGNQLTEVTREEGAGTLRTRTMTYDPQNRVTYEGLPGGMSNTYTYDPVGNLKTLDDGGGKVEYTYDDVNQQRSVFEPGATRATRFEHDVDGLRTKTTYPNDVSITWDHDQAFRLTGIEARKANGPILQQLAYQYEQPSTQRQTPLRYEKTDHVRNQRTRYVYDGLDRLEGAVITAAAGPDTTTPLASYAYQLDQAGNVTMRTVVEGPSAPTLTTHYAYNAANQLCWRSPTYNAAPPSTACTPATLGGTQQTAYDRNGNEEVGPAGSNRTAAYNLMDQTKVLTIGASPTSILYLGAGQDRWIKEGTSDIQHNVLGFGSRGTTKYTRDEAGTLVSRRNGAARGYYLTDALGSVVGLTDSSGNLADRNEYDPYGNAAPSGTGLWGAGTTDIPNGYVGFAGGYRSVGGLYHFGQRYYDPSAMRWTQTDPLDQTGDVRDGNPYLYASADPVDLTDLAGTHPCGDPGRHAPQGENNECSGGPSKCPEQPLNSPCEKSDDLLGPRVRNAIKVAGKAALGCAEGALAASERVPPSNWKIAAGALGCVVGAAGYNGPYH